MFAKESCKGAVAAFCWLLLAVGSGTPYARTVAPKRLVEVVDLSGPIVSPDGRLVAYRSEQASVERNTYDTAWYVQDVDGSAPPRRLADAGVLLRESPGAPVAPEASWAPDSRFIYYRAMLDGRISVWRSAVDGSGSESVTDDAADVRAFELGADGKSLRYSVGATREEIARAEQHEYDGGIHIDATVPVGASLFRSRFIDGALRTQRYWGIGWNREALLRDRPDRWREVDLDSRTARDLSSSEVNSSRSTDLDVPDGAVKPIRVVREPLGHRVALVKPVYADHASQLRSENLLDWYELSVVREGETSEPLVCRHPLCTKKRISSVIWRPGGDGVIFTVTDRNASNADALFRWDLASGDVHPIAASGGSMNGGRAYASTCGVSKDALVCVVAEAQVPPRLERIEIESGRRVVFFEPNVSLANDLAKSISSRLLRWKDKKGQEFSGYLFSARKSADARRPLFINFYQCAGFLRGGVGNEWPLATLAEAGISALCINAPPYQQDPLARYGQALTAVESVVDLLAREGETDRSRVGMGGLSFGAESTLWVAMKSDLLAATSVTSPFATPIYYLLASLRGEAFLSGLQENWQLGSPEETPKQWRRLSPTYNVDKIQAPMLLQMPEEEYIYSLDYVVPLIHRHKADLFVFPEEPHVKFQPRHLQAAYERNFDWFRFWLQGVEDRALQKEAQYARWRMMKESLSKPKNYLGK